MWVTSLNRILFYVTAEGPSLRDLLRVLFWDFRSQDRDDLWQIYSADSRYFVLMPAMMNRAKRSKLVILASLLLAPSVRGFVSFGKVAAMRRNLFLSLPPFLADDANVSRRHHHPHHQPAEPNSPPLTNNVILDSRREFAKKVVVGASGALLPAAWSPRLSNAAPPIAVIAEELGYFPVTNANQETIYVPKRIKRESTNQAIRLARKLRESGAVVYTAYWCPVSATNKDQGRTGQSQSYLTGIESHANASCG